MFLVAWYQRPLYNWYLLNVFYNNDNMKVAYFLDIVFERMYKAFQSEADLEHVWKN